MAEEKLDKQWQNPCRYCLVKPACIKKCKLLKNHIELFELTAVTAVLLSVLLIMICIVLMCYYISKPIAIIGTIIYIIILYGYMLHHHIKNPSELREMKPWERWTIIILFPWLMPGVGAWIVIENKIDESGYMFRFHKCLDPYIDVKKERQNAKLRRALGQSQSHD